MDGWTDAILMCILGPSQLVIRDGRTDEWMDGQTENTDVLTDGRTYGRQTDR